MRPIGIRESGRLGRHSLLLREGQAGTRNIKHRVFFRRVGGQAEFASARRIHEFQLYVLADTFNIVIRPIFIGVGLRLATALVQGPVPSLALSVAFKVIRLAVHDVDAAAIGSPAGNAGRVMLVSIGDAAIVLFFYGIIDRIRIRIAPLPEFLDELLALFVGLELQESFALGVRDDVNNVFAQPLFVGGGEFLQNLLIGLFLLIGILFLV